MPASSAASATAPPGSITSRSRSAAQRCAAAVSASLTATPVASRRDSTSKVSGDTRCVWSESHAVGGGFGPTGSIQGYSREGSKTDVAAELTSLIQTQRAYSSNAKVIQTVDEMLQETTNIKR